MPSSVVVNNPSRKPLFFSIAGAFIVLIALDVMLGWVFNVDVMRRVVPGVAAMKFNTAFCFFLLGSAFLLLFYCDRFVHRAFCYGFSLFVIAFILLSLSQDVFGWSAGIDELVVKDPSNFP